MPALSTHDRLRTALGGFVSFTGLLILAIVILTATGAADLQSIFQNGAIIGMIAFLGILDFACGLMLVLKDKILNLRFLFTPHKNKTKNHVD